MKNKRNISNTEDRKIRLEELMKRVVDDINRLGVNEIKFPYARKFTGDEIVQLITRVKSDCKCVNGCTIDAEYITFIKEVG